MVSINIKTIESDIFGLTVGQTTVQHVSDIEDIAQCIHYDLIDIRLPEGKIELIKDIKKIGAIDVGCMVTYQLRVGTDPLNIEHPDNNCREATANDFNECLRIVKESFILYSDMPNRFNSDPNFSYSDRVKYWSEWIKNCFNGVSADKLIVYDNGKIRGFISYKKISENHYNIPLNAVERRSRGQGIYTKLVRYVVTELVKLSSKPVIDIRTYSDNISVQKTWMGMGADKKDMECVFHFRKGG